MSEDEEFEETEFEEEEQPTKKKKRSIVDMAVDEVLGSELIDFWSN